jgi:hypothetical protein
MKQKLFNMTIAIVASGLFVIFLVLSTNTAIAQMSVPQTTAPQTSVNISAIAKSPDLELRTAKVKYLADLDMLVFEQKVKGTIGNTLPQAKGQLDGAAVLGYVFPTTLKSEDVGFNHTDGVVALAVTSHPDFDDTPLWDENNDRNYANDGKIFHAHWVVLVPDKRVAGGLAVKQFKKEEAGVVLPPTNPGMPMYMDSPGFSVIANQNTLRVFVPAQRIQHKTDFNFDAVTAYMQVNTSDENRPMLGVYQVYTILSKKLSLPYTVQRQ